MSQSQDLFPLFLEIAEEIEKRKLPNVTATSVIAELGIDSLAMMQIVGELESRLGVMIPDDQLVKLVTVADLLKVVQGRVGQ